LLRFWSGALTPTPIHLQLSFCTSKNLDHPQPSSLPAPPQPLHIPRVRLFTRDVGVAAARLLLSTTAAAAARARVRPFCAPCDACCVRALTHLAHTHVQRACLYCLSPHAHTRSCTRARARHLIAAAHPPGLPHTHARKLVRVVCVAAPAGSSAPRVLVRARARASRTRDCALRLDIIFLFTHLKLCRARRASGAFVSPIDARRRPAAADTAAPL
jgi:hypothetical protein